jgi:hypothetical protein
MTKPYTYKTYKVNVENVTQLRAISRMNAKHVTYRLKSLRERAGLSMEAMAKTLDFKGASSYQRYENPETFTKDVLPAHIIQKMMTRLIGKGDPAIAKSDILALAGIDSSQSSDMPLSAPGTNTIPEIDVRGGMGGGGEAGIEYIPDGNGGHVASDVVRGSWTLPNEYLRSELRVESGSLRIIEVQGDSMEPTLRSGDRVMINSRDKRPSPPGVFALWDGYGVVVKRIELIPNSEPATVKIISDNQNHNQYDRTVDEVNVIGRVVWFARRV